MSPSVPSHLNSALWRSPSILSSTQAMGQEMGQVAYMSSCTKGAAVAPMTKPYREHAACQGSESSGGREVLLGAVRTGVASESWPLLRQATAVWLEGRVGCLCARTLSNHPPGE